MSLTFDEIPYKEEISIDIPSRNHRKCIERFMYLYFCVIRNEQGKGVSLLA
ncbi:hypothetical protein SAMN04488541_100678 [Thermoflexibacter ruber]|uniref:Uncharacterized protein n=1 Tax=Thermoflexibacter ruber TaxID=1003 RepID=A0A1I2D5R1_9BACT|nr:hypothetical protein SAMN04488541_100678 [Thermoflexibacter ruber]